MYNKRRLRWPPFIIYGSSALSVAVFCNSYIGIKKDPPEGESFIYCFRLNYFTITTRLVPLTGKMFSEEPTPFQVS